MPSKTKRRDAGSGALFQDSRGLWTARVELPAGPDGKRRVKVVRSKSKDEAADKLKALNRDLGKFGDLPTSSPTLGAWMPLWLARLDRLKPRTSRTYRTYSERYIVPTLGKVRLERLSPAHVYALRDKIAGPKPGGLGLSTTTALQAHRILAHALRDASRAGLVTKNVADKEHTDAPVRAVAVRPSLVAADVRTLLDSVNDDERAWLMWSLALTAGLRQGERLGVTLGALHLDATDEEGNPRPILSVEWQLQRLPWGHGCGGACGRKRGAECPERTVVVPADQEARRVTGGLWLTRPKSRAGWRQVPLLPAVAERLSRWVDEHPTGPEGLVFGAVDPRADADAWDAMLKAAGVPDVPLHSARHTCATLLADLGVDEQTRMQILGHSSATVTRGYTHVTSSAAARGIGALGALLAPRQIAAR